MSVEYKIERIKNTDVAEYKIRIFAFFLLNNADVKNCGASRGFGFIYIYIDYEISAEDSVAVMQY